MEVSDIPTELVPVDNSALTFSDEGNADPTLPEDNAPIELTEPSGEPEIPSFDEIDNEVVREKMKRIYLRRNLKGLKGFCPVNLRDHRALVDALPEFHSTFRGQQFHFADATAKGKFDKDPILFAPVAFGADVVVLSREDDAVEGSLDFAAWFKNRLYLFKSQENCDTFFANPDAYIEFAGII
ncbi:MAG: hypothetical protein WCJ09_16095 [Planctomycetota bacterium]